jgi:hypothetical protein
MRLPGAAFVLIRSILTRLLQAIYAFIVLKLPYQIRHGQGMKKSATSALSPWRVKWIIMTTLTGAIGRRDMLFYLHIAEIEGPLGIVDTWIHQYSLSTRLAWCQRAGLA